MSTWSLGIPGNETPIISSSRQYLSDEYVSVDKYIANVS
jgi:hypothetical protein